MLYPLSSQAITLSAAQAAAIAVAALVMAVGLDTTRVLADDLIVRYDQAQLLRLPRPVSEVIVGNPSIADVTISGGNLLVITGKTFGITNVIAIDTEHNIIQDQKVIVERDQTVVNLRRGPQRETYSCTPQCQPNLTIGDDQLFFETLGKQSSMKTKISESGPDGDR
jgi:Flp pilus assembly secretin CpaC